MTRTFENTKFGDVTLRNIMIHNNDTNLEEGLEVKINSMPKPIEIFGYYRLDDITNEEVEEILYEHI